MAKRWTTLRRSAWLAPRRALVWLLAVVVLIGLLGPIAGVRWMPPVMVAVPVLLAGLLVPRRSLLFVFALGVLAVIYDELLVGWSAARPGQLIVLAAIAAVAYRLASTRERLGVQGVRGESMLVELRDRLRAQGELPKLPAEWQSEALLRSAGTTSFGGDFLVAALTGDDSRLEVVLVDVSGKGLDAASRALLLAGALGGLLGAVPAEQFLPAANDYLLRQQWQEGFATAVHLALDLKTGRYLLQTAGHPPAAQFASGSGIWRLLETDSSMLGIMPDATFGVATGVLARGDAMLLYTDGVVETAERELAVGIDKLVGEAERLVTQGFRNGARRLIDLVAPNATDDRALVIIWRE